MALLGGHRFSVSMGEAFPHGLYAMGVEQAQDYNERNGSRTPSKDKQTGDLVWTVTCIDRDPEARVKEVRVKVLAPVQPVLTPEVVAGSGLRPVEFSGMTVTPYIDEGRGRARMALSFRATGVHEPGKALASSATVTGRSGGQAPGGESKVA